MYVMLSFKDFAKDRYGQAELIQSRTKTGYISFLSISLFCTLESSSIQMEKEMNI